MPKTFKVQYIVTRSGNKRALEGLHRYVRDLQFPYQWEASDFKAIAQAFDDLFNDLGWKK